MGDSRAIDGAAVPLWAQHALGARPLSLRQQTLSQSGNEVYRACMPDGRSLVLRLSAHARAFAHTRANLHALRRLGLPVQTVLAEGRTPAGGAYVVLDWLPGRDLYYVLPELSGAQAERIAAMVTTFQHRVAASVAVPPGESFGWAPKIGERAQRATWSAIFGAPVTEDVLAALRNRPDATPLDHCRARLGCVRAALEGYFAALRPVCFLHDLTVKNVLIDGGELSGLIDFDCVCYGDPMMVVGVTLAHLEADVGEAGRTYGEALLRCWRPTGEQLRAAAFYAALWATGFVSIALDAGDHERARALVPAAQRLLTMAEGA